MPLDNSLVIIIKKFIFHQTLCCGKNVLVCNQGARTNEIVPSVWVWIVVFIDLSIVVTGRLQLVVYKNLPRILIHGGCMNKSIDVCAVADFTS